MAQSKTKIYIVYYSMYGHVRQMAEAVKKGAEQVSGVQVQLFQVPETLPNEVLEKMYAPPKSDDPIITAKDLTRADGIIFGIPTRFGSAPAQMKAFMDTTGQIWKSRALYGKPGGVFTSVGVVAQETTVISFISHFVQHGMVYVPLGCEKEVTDITEPHGGSAWGAGTLSAEDGSRMPSTLELAGATVQGKHFAATAKALKLGREHSSK